MEKSIGIIGAGAYGTALGQVLSSAYAITLYNDLKNIVDEINNNHTNNHFLPKTCLNPKIKATVDFSSISEHSLIIIAVPTQAVRSVCVQMSDILPSNIPIISCSKGIENSTGLLITEVINSILKNPALALSGPSFAREMARQLPCSVNLASDDYNLSKELSELLTVKNFSVIPIKDVIGLQLCGALKNILAIGVGVICGLNLGHGGKSATLTKGIKEIASFIEAVTNNHSTITELGGVGDIVLTCLNEESRNYTLGFNIAAGNVSLPLFQETTQTEPRPLAEGLLTLRSWSKIYNRYKKSCHMNVSMPLFDGIYALLYENMSISEFVELAI